MGFVLPLRDWFRGPMRRRVEEILLGLPGPVERILRRGSTADVWKSFLDGSGTTSASRVFALASLAAWVAENEMELPW